MKTKASQIALGGMLSAVAVVIMCLGSLIPVNTYVCPVLCILLTRPLLERCGRRIAGCYYGAVCILSLLFAPDREAAVVYAFLGYYPLIKPWFDRIPGSLFPAASKLAFFTAAGAAAYALLLAIIGMAELSEDFSGGGMWIIAVFVIMWDFMFLLVDKVLAMDFRRYR